MKKLITKFQDVGICEVNVSKVVKAWNEKFSISQYHDDYTLVKQGRSDRHAKVKISKEQALEIIEKAKLLLIQSKTFRYGITYRSEGDILSKVAKFKKIVVEKTNELDVLQDCLSEYVDALKK
jgi:hypothetical protein